MSSSSSSCCKTCSGPAASQCSLCKSVWYCSTECQRADWKRHKRQECNVASSSSSSSRKARQDNNNNPVSLLPANFRIFPQLYLRCIHCGNPFSMCACSTLSLSQRGRDLIFVLDPIPSHVTTMQRINRWALLVKHHPILKVIDAEQFVKDLPSTFSEDLELTRPIVQNLMDQFVAGKHRGPKKSLKAYRKTLGIFCKEGADQSVKDCAYVMEHFFQGNWSYPCVMEFCFLSNAIRLAGPNFQEKDPEMQLRTKSVFHAIEMILSFFRIAGQGEDFNFRLEDIANIS